MASVAFLAEETPKEYDAAFIRLCFVELAVAGCTGIDPWRELYEFAESPMNSECVLGGNIAFHLDLKSRRARP